MSDKGTIKIPREDFERHNERRKDLGLTWAEYIDGEAPQHDVPDVDEVAATLEAAMDVNGLSYDDVKQACAAAIRDELPEVR